MLGNMLWRKDIDTGVDGDDVHTRQKSSFQNLPALTTESMRGDRKQWSYNRKKNVRRGFVCDFRLFE